MIFSTKIRHASTRNQTIWRPYRHSVIVMISLFYNIPLILRWISHWYGTFNKNILIFQTNAIWTHTTCLFLCCVHFLPPLGISAHALVQNKVIWGPHYWSRSIFSKQLWNFIITAIYSFLPINENVFLKPLDITHAIYINQMLHCLPVNIRVYPQKKLDLRVARVHVNHPPPPPHYLITFNSESSRQWFETGAVMLMWRYSL